MAGILAGVFLILHGLVHLLYFGHSMRFFKLKPEMAWPDGALCFSRIFSFEVTRNITANACVLAAIGFIAGAAGLFASQGWWQPVTGISAAFSSLIFILGWDGERTGLSEKGLFALLINAGILILIFVVHWPSVG